MTWTRNDGKTSEVKVVEGWRWVDGPLWGLNDSREREDVVIG